MLWAQPRRVAGSLRYFACEASCQDLLGLTAACKRFGINAELVVQCSYEVVLVKIVVGGLRDLAFV